MTLTLICSCGRTLAVSAELAGRHCCCQVCGNILQVPAMGIVEGTSKPHAPHHHPQTPLTSRRPRILWPWLLGTLTLLLGTGAVLILRSLNHEPEADHQVSLPIHTDESLPKSNPPPPRDKVPADPVPTTPVKPPERAKPIDLPVPPKPIEQKPPVPPAGKAKPAPPIPPKNVFGPPLRLEWKLRQGDKLFQDLRVVQKPTFNVGGIPIASSLQYHVLSSFTVTKRDADKVTVQQKVESAELLQADPLTQGLLAPMVLKLPGTTFTMEFNARMEVARFTGAAGKPQMAGLNLPGLQGMQMSALLDADGWKEIAQLTFFQPNRGLAVGDKWTKPLTHNWGALGNWNGKANYAYVGRKKSLHQVDYALQLAYQAPKGGWLVADAVFRPVQAGGAIIFDAEQGRVVEAQERFQVRGRLSINLLGQKTLVDVEEDQLFFVRVLDRKQ